MGLAMKQLFTCGRNQASPEACFHDNAATLVE